MSSKGRILVQTTRGLFLASAAAWLLVAVLIASGAVSIGSVPPAVRLVLAGLMAAFAAVLAYLGLRCLRGSPLVDGIALAVAAANVLATLTDQVGGADIAYLIFSLVLLAALSTAWVLQRRASRANQAGARPR